MSKLCLMMFSVMCFNTLYAADDFFGDDTAQVITGNVSSNDNNTNSLPTMVSLPRYGTLSSTAGVDELGADGSFTYTPDSGFSGVDAFVYQLADELFEVRLLSGSIHILSADNPNLALSVSSASNRILAELQPRSTAPNVSWSILGENAELEFKTGLSSARSYVLETWMPSGTGEQVSLYRKNNKLWQDFSIESNLSGNHKIRSQFTNYTIKVSNDSSVIAQPPVTDGSDNWLFTGVNQTPPPSAKNDAFNIPVNSILDGNVLNNDSANGPDIASFLISAPQNGQLIGINQDIYGGLAPFGSFTYQPDPGFEGVDHFTYMSMGSASGAPSKLTTVSIMVGSNNNPVANDDMYYGDVNDIIHENVLYNDLNEGAGFFDPQAVMVSAPRNGSLVGIYSEIYDGLAPFGDFEYQPNPGFNGVDSFAYKVINNGVESPVATVYLTVGEVKLAPLGHWYLRLGADSLANRTPFSLLRYTQNTDQNFQIKPIGSSELSYLHYSNKALETWAPQAQGLDATLYNFNALPWQQFSLHLQPSGSVIIQSEYTSNVLQVLEPVLGSQVITQTLTGDKAQQWMIAGPNQTYAPSALDDEFTTPKETLLEGNILGNDTANSFDILATHVIGPFNGQLDDSIYEGGVTPFGTFTYQPNPGFVGQDYFIYQAFSSSNGAPSRYTTVIINVSE